MSRKIRILVGSVSEGTANPRNLLPRLASELERLAGRTDLVDATDAVLLVIKMIESGYGEPIPPILDKIAKLLVDELIDNLNEYAPPYVRFGAHEDDENSLGWWLLRDELERADNVLRVESLSEIPTRYVGLVLLANDPDNGTLYLATGDNYLAAGGNLIELWTTQEAA